MIKAVFQGTASLSPSPSAYQALKVTGTYLSTVMVSASGSAGTYNLTAKLDTSGASTPGGTISFTDADRGDATLGWATLTPSDASHSVAQQLTIDRFNGSLTPDVLAADFTGDGIIDLIANRTTYRGTGDGTFGTGIMAQVGTIAADLNEDGILDLTGSDGNIFIGQGDGSFIQKSIATSEYISTVADFNRDGIPDLATFATDSAGRSAIKIWTGTGDGTNALASTTTVPDYRQACAGGDVNGDGIVDLVVVSASEFGSSATVLLGNGDGTFTTKNFAVEFDTFGLALADFNGDGILDLATTTASHHDFSPFFPTPVTIRLGVGDGSFVTKSSYAGVSYASYQIKSGDFNGDGITDLVIGRRLDQGTPVNGQLRILLGAGDGTFSVMSVVFGQLS